MRKGYEKQILDYNVEKFNMIVTADLDMFSSMEILTQADQDVSLHINSISGVKKIIEDL